MVLGKAIIWQHARWTMVEKNDNIHMIESGYDLILRREPSISHMKANHGQMVTGIDAKSTELIKKYPLIKQTFDMILADQENACISCGGLNPEACTYC